MRACVIVLDSAGVGHAPDAEKYGDEGADTLGHLLARDALLPQKLQTLWSLGLGQILDRDPVRSPLASYGRMTEISAGKDSTTGHWEIAGAPVTQPFGLFDYFPPELVHAIERDANTHFIGNFPASGTAIVDQLGPQHIRTGHPILYTSADSVLQIAAHEQVIPLNRLYEICRTARRHADEYRIGRVIARPFIGTPGNFQRTANRHDYSMLPPRTVLDAISESGLPVIAVGKIADLFAARGITYSNPTKSNHEGMSLTSQLWRKMIDGFLFVNLVDFDTNFGHRRDPDGYISALAAFDRWLESFLPRVSPQDLLIITADHGTDPTFKGSDHTREQVPLLVYYMNSSRDLAMRGTFADIAASLCNHFRLEDWRCGTSFIPKAVDQELLQPALMSAPLNL